MENSNAKIERRSDAYAEELIRKGAGTYVEEWSAEVLIRAEALIELIRKYNTQNSWTEEEELVRRCTKQ